MESITFKMNRTEVNNPETGSSSEGYTIVVDGQLKNLFDRIIALDPQNYPNYGNIIGKCLTRGIQSAVNDLSKKN